MITYAEAKKRALAGYPHYDKCTDCGNVWAFGTKRPSTGLGLIVIKSTGKALSTTEAIYQGVDFGGKSTDLDFSTGKPSAKKKTTKPKTKKK